MLSFDELGQNRARRLVNRRATGKAQRDGRRAFMRSRRFDNGLNLNSLFVVHIDVIGKIPDDALDGLAYFRLPEPIHDAAHHVYLGHG